ncbi:MAG: hypothetical protein J3K34DRAFT_403047 [Monoraphidium minutum]|nr:MAG: hypothetical protein J3K34DRAFT_403047 [Monoraphidium minutum]
MMAAATAARTRAWRRRGSRRRWPRQRPARRARCCWGPTPRCSRRRRLAAPARRSSSTQSSAPSGAASRLRPTTSTSPRAWAPRTAATRCTSGAAPTASWRSSWRARAASLCLTSRGTRPTACLSRSRRGGASTSGRACLRRIGARSRRTSRSSSKT